MPVSRPYGKEGIPLLTKLTELEAAMTPRSKDALLTQVIKHSSDKELEGIIRPVEAELERRRRIVAEPEKFVASRK